MNEMISGGGEFFFSRSNEHDYDHELAIAESPTGLLIEVKGGFLIVPGETIIFQRAGIK